MPNKDSDKWKKNVLQIWGWTSKANAWKIATWSSASSFFSVKVYGYTFIFSAIFTMENNIICDFLFASLADIALIQEGIQEGLKALSGLPE